MAFARRWNRDEFAGLNPTLTRFSYVRLISARESETDQSFTAE